MALVFQITKKSDYLTTSVKLSPIQASYPTPEEIILLTSKCILTEQDIVSVAEKSSEHLTEDLTEKYDAPLLLSIGLPHSELM